MTAKRSRSNSRSTGSDAPNLQPPPLLFQQEEDQSLENDNINPIATTLIASPKKTTENQQVGLTKHRYTNILILKSLNGTFETKFLIIPYLPETLKLGRPVTNNSNNGNSRNSIIRSDNGNFDSRVLSRSHASLFTDPRTNTIFIKDLNSSNGTFLNNSRLLADQNYKLNIGDVIDLGTDIDNKLEHRRISAFVEDISLIPILSTSTLNTNPSASGISTPIHLSLNAQRIAFDAAMFGDISDSQDGQADLNDDLLGKDTSILSGIFINSSTGTSPNIISMIKLLNTEISLEEYENDKLVKLNKYLKDYRLNMKSLYYRDIEELQKNFKMVKDSITKNYNEKLETLTRKNNNNLDILRAEIESLKLHINPDPSEVANQHSNDITDSPDSSNYNSKVSEITSPKIDELRQQLITLKQDLELQKLENHSLTQKIINDDGYNTSNKSNNPNGTTQEEDEKVWSGPGQVRAALLLGAIGLALGWVLT
ncbi:hypothetical protein TBLA_0H00800 [Henningerozyma blattae CBS 6284]|uniref:FHA domain-containing protein n=1 Tax=Henningerozyma blattae (strain ATCC 34711 / CBS 6284 / DSM 70876 / NBRC 10599 / NRRL Y-10934 / UCD 77-7) TaxID=1071380 RepID=I2H7L7_HENB6|nr:hypothetical protein TBLA_0H00800 [Tetrapisispora blattae CBS 6284]CCH62369.1 hypothetical protein TBLA_0H00800 [Tetrapisispora blattae CBS 6284]